MPVTDRVSVSGYVMVSVQFYNPYAAIPAVAERRGSGTLNGGTVIVNGEKIKELPNQVFGGRRKVLQWLLLFFL
ncbi:MAG: hypothetical protein K5744_04105 [Eubacterium sp.]|nr:hypothetical protein [Eubacterium sp.]